MPVRPATPDDVPHLVRLVEELAEYERAREEVELTAPLLHEALFGAGAVAGCHVAVAGADAVVGLALWFRTFSTWTGLPGLHLEDLFVRPEHRGSGHGTALLAALARHCVEHGYRRLEWAVLTWNEPAIGFYRSVGAVPLEQWQTHRLGGDALRALARKSAP